jgi:hypothetical protein
MNAKIFPAFFLLTIFFVSCKTKESKIALLQENMQIQTQDIQAKEKESDNEKQLPVTGKILGVSDTTARSVSQAPPSNPDWDKKIIKTAGLKLEVKDFTAYNNSLHNTVKQNGGYIAQEEQNLSEEKSESVVTIKVPVEQFENMMNQLPGNAIKVLERKINTEDVTGEVVDTKSRLEAKKQMRFKYLEFLKQSKNMEEVLQVQNEINGIQEEIESASGRVAFLSHQAAYSTINLTFFQPLSGFIPANENPSFITRIATAFKTGGSWFTELFIALIALWPLILSGFAGYYIFRKWRNNRVVVKRSKS